MKYYDTDMIKKAEDRGAVFSVVIGPKCYGRSYYERKYKERMKQKLNDKYGVKNEILHDEKH